MSRPGYAHDRRRILHVNVTRHPTSAWTRQQLREAFADHATARYLLHDGDATFDAAFDRAVDAFGLTSLRTAPRSPWQNPYVERVIGSIRRECLDHVVVLNERHLRRLLRSYLADYHGSRTHLALGKDAPEPRAIEPAGAGHVVARPEVGGGCTIATNGKPPDCRLLQRLSEVRTHVCLRPDPSVVGTPWTSVVEE